MEVRRKLLFLLIFAIIFLNYAYSVETNYTQALQVCSSKVSGISDLKTYNLYPPMFTWLALWNTGGSGLPCNGIKCVVQKCPPNCYYAKDVKPKDAVKVEKIGKIDSWEFGNNYFKIFLFGECRWDQDDETLEDWRETRGWWGPSGGNSNNTLLFIDKRCYDCGILGCICDEDTMKWENYAILENSVDNIPFYMKYSLFTGSRDIIYPYNFSLWVGIAQDYWEVIGLQWPPIKYFYDLSFLVDPYYSPVNNPAVAKRGYLYEKDWGGKQWIKLFGIDIQGIESGKIVKNLGRLQDSPYYHAVVSSSLWRYDLFLNDYLNILGDTDDSDIYWEGSYIKTLVDWKRYLYFSEIVDGNTTFYPYANVYYSSVFYPSYFGFYFKDFTDLDPTYVWGRGFSCVCKDEKLGKDGDYTQGTLGNCNNGYCTDVYLLTNSKIFIDVTPSVWEVSREVSLTVDWKDYPFLMKGSDSSLGGRYVVQCADCDYYLYESIKDLSVIVVFYNLTREDLITAVGLRFSPSGLLSIICQYI